MELMFKWVVECLDNNKEGCRDGSVDRMGSIERWFSSEKGYSFVSMISGVNMKTNKMVAFSIWCVGCYATCAFVTELGVPSTNYTNLFVGVIVQSFLTFAEKRFLTIVPKAIKTKNTTTITLCVFLLFAFALDVVLNAGYFLPYLGRVIHTTASINLFGVLPNWASIVFAIVVSTFIALSVELLTYGE